MMGGLKKRVEEEKELASKYLDPKTNKFDYETLKGKFPEGVNPTIKEAYLEENNFKEIFGMTMDEFNSLKKWKQQELKKKHMLF